MAWLKGQIEATQGQLPTFHIFRMPSSTIVGAKALVMIATKTVLAIRRHH
jgi:hypothetical protein